VDYLVLAQEYADQITEAYQRTIEGIIDAGTLLLRAKDAIPKGNFRHMVNTKLPFSPSTAERLMKIASDQRLLDLPRKALPPRWSVLHEMTKLTDAEFEELKPQITPELERGEIRRFRKQKGDMAPGKLTFEFPEPPTVNDMLTMAKRRDGKGRPIIYDIKKKQYYDMCDLLVLAQKAPRPPKKPWARWRIRTIDQRRHQELDLVELTASLKWPVDWLVKRNYVANDSPRELLGPLPHPSQHIDRGDRGLTMVIEHVI